MKEDFQKIKEAYPQRKKDARKYDHGLVIIIGGSKIYTGSSVLSAMAALRSGADIAQIVAPSRVADIAASFSPDLITFPLQGDHLSPKHLSEILALTRSGQDVSRGKVAVVLGGGIGRDEETKKVVRQYVKETNAPLVIDADAIYAFENKKEFIRQCALENKKILFTPHIYEFYILSGRNIKTLSDEEKSLEVKEAAKEISATILLKGGTDFISDGKEVKRNEVSIPYLTSGGTGDVLAGIAGTLLARGFSPLVAGLTAALINSAAGKIGGEEKGESLIAGDVVDNIYKVVN